MKEIVGEVKWKENVNRGEIRKIEERLGKFKDCKKILIVPEKKILERKPEEIEVWDVKRILEEIKKSK
ncbi:MAG: hypothetical protein DRP54_09575 [Spirochaetes bacterium]|nr:MAG: hypothetical protein DRP54_09575 [Spirochaetota bacterium]